MKKEPTARWYRTKGIWEAHARVKRKFLAVSYISKNWKHTICTPYGSHIVRVEREEAGRAPVKDV